MGMAKDCRANRISRVTGRRSYRLFASARRHAGTGYSGEAEFTISHFAYTFFYPAAIFNSKQKIL
jgi:hypothetical protein